MRSSSSLLLLLRRPEPAGVRPDPAGDMGCDPAADVGYRGCPYPASVICAYTGGAYAAGGKPSTAG